MLLIGWKAALCPDDVAPMSIQDQRVTAKAMTTGGLVGDPAGGMTTIIKRHDDDR